MKNDMADQPGDNQKWATMEQVAAAAGVSIMTVSRALSTPDKVARGTRERIREAIRELGYVPDRAASSLASRRSGLIAAFVSTLSGSVFAETIDSLAAHLRKEGYHVLLGTTHYSTSEEEELIAAALSRRPDGLVLTGGIHTEAARKLVERASVPIVETWDLPRDPIDLAVGFSHYDAARSMTHQLHRWGYRRIAFMGDDSGHDIRGRQRLAGYLAGTATLGMPGDRIVKTGNAASTITDGAVAVRELMRDHPESDALFCVSDIAAMGAILECQRQGIDVPGQLAIAGFGDFDIADDTALALTTVHIPGAEIGEIAGDLLIKHIQGQEIAYRTVDVGFEIIRRKTA